MNGSASRSTSIWHLKSSYMKCHHAFTRHYALYRTPWLIHHLGQWPFKQFCCLHPRTLLLHEYCFSVTPNGIPALEVEEKLFTLWHLEVLWDIICIPVSLSSFLFASDHSWIHGREGTGDVVRKLCSLSPQLKAWEWRCMCGPKNSPTLDARSTCVSTVVYR